LPVVNGVPFPRGVDGLSVDWLTSVLHSAERLSAPVGVASFRAERIGEGVGMTSYLYRLHLTYEGSPTVKHGEGSAPATVIVKFATDDPTTRSMIDSLSLYQREVRFYAELSEGNPFRIPFCYLAQQATDSTDFILVLEDVGALSAIDQLIGCTWEQSVLAVQTVAGFHAKWWEHASLDGLSETFPPLSLPGYKVMLPYLFGVGLEFLKTLLPELISPSIATFAEQWGTYCPAILDAIAEPKTLCHGDWRADNLFIDGDNMAALDFQILGIGSGLYDVAYFTSQSMEPSVRAGRDRELIALYVAALQSHGVSIDLEVAWRQYRQALMFCFIYPVNLMSGYETMDPRGQELMRTILIRSAAAVEDTHAIEALPPLDGSLHS
jgi:Phosphotransferase enzyme family/Ecdysteroid kinase-like family